MTCIEFKKEFERLVLASQGGLGDLDPVLELFEFLCDNRKTISALNQKDWDDLFVEIKFLLICLYHMDFVEEAALIYSEVFHKNIRDHKAGDPIIVGGSRIIDRAENTDYMDDEEEEEEEVEE